MMEVKDHLGNIYSNESEMCKKYNISQSTFYQRYHKYNWTLEEALTIPVRKQTSKRRKITKIVRENKPKQNLQEGFFISSNYPSKEYVRHLKYIKKGLEELISNCNDISVECSVREQVKQINEKIGEVESESFSFQIMDMIYAGKHQAAREICSQKTFLNCMSSFSNPQGLIRTIYISFAQNMITNKENMDRK